MMSKAAKEATRNTEKAVQRCIDPSCGAAYGLREPIYVCPRCSGTLEIDCHLAAREHAVTLRKAWAERAASRDPRDQSGVWRYREMLPFDEDAPIVTAAIIDRRMRERRHHSPSTRTPVLLYQMAGSRQSIRE